MADYSKQNFSQHGGNVNQKEQNPSKLFYCVSCRARRQGINIEAIRMKNGKFAMKANCEIDGVTMFKIGGPNDFNVQFRSLTPDRELIKVCGVLNRELAIYLADHSWELYTIPPSFFERLVAEILSSFGFEVQVNIRLLGLAKGDEADILAFIPISGMVKRIGYVVECKRYAEYKRVDLQIATHLYGLKQRHAEQWGLDHALLATTSTVTDQVAHEYGSRWDFEIADHARIVEWLKHYSTVPEKMLGSVRGMYKPLYDVPILIDRIKD